MENKNNKTDVTVLPADFFGDVVDAQYQSIITYKYKYGDQSVEVKCKPILSHHERQEFVEAVWASYYAKDGAGNYDFRPYVLDAVIRLLTVKLYCVNLHIDLENEISLYETFLMGTDFYDKLITHLRDYDLLIHSLYDYIDRRVTLQNSVSKNRLDYVFEKLMVELVNLFGKINNDIKDISEDDLKSVINEIKNATKVE